MSWEVVWADRAREDLRRLDRQMAKRIVTAVLRLADAGQGDVKKLTGEGDELRLRVGDWRVRFQFLHGTGTMEVLRVLHRSRAYRD